MSEHDTWPPPGDDEPTDPGGHAPERAPAQLSGYVDASTVARLVARYEARLDRQDATLARQTDLLLELLQAVRTRPCMHEPEPCPLRAVGEDR